VRELPLTLACHGYDRKRSTHDRSIPIEGVVLNYTNLHLPDVFWGMCEYHVSHAPEISIRRDKAPDAAIVPSGPLGLVDARRGGSAQGMGAQGTRPQGGRSRA